MDDRLPLMAAMGMASGSGADGAAADTEFFFVLLVAGRPGPVFCPASSDLRLPPFLAVVGSPLDSSSRFESSW
jgi:hypothetical protein